MGDISDPLIVGWAGKPPSFRWDKADLPKMWEVSEDVGKEKSKLHTRSSQELDAKYAGQLGQPRTERPLLDSDWHSEHSLHPGSQFQGCDAFARVQQCRIKWRILKWSVDVCWCLLFFSLWQMATSTGCLLYISHSFPTLDRNWSISCNLGGISCQRSSTIARVEPSLSQVTSTVSLLSISKD